MTATPAELRAIARELAREIRPRYFLRVNQAADYLGVSVNHLRQWSREPGFPPQRRHGSVRGWLRRELEEWAEAHLERVR